ncbi:DUF3326 domain-containing protein [bacterium]|nr:DUF3326 domain-containing protein [bacterium]
MIRPFTALMIVPTGLGAEVGGYAGDATPAANLLAAACDRLVTHPNVVNAASLFAARPNVWYVEGGMLDRFCLGEGALRPVRSNRVGLLIDRTIVDQDPEGLLHLLTAADACRAVQGVPMVGWLPTSEPVRSRIVLGEQGASSGEVENPQVLLEGAKALLAQGAEAIALVTRMPELPEAETEAYLAGGGPDPIGGLEAVLSHVVTRGLGVPCAHAPYESPDRPMRVDPRVAAESVGFTFLPCILEGLRRAPRLVPLAEREATDLLFAQVDAVVAPWGACGGIPVLAAHRLGLPIVAVRDNRVASQADPVALGLSGVLEVGSYLEAAGALLALKEGLAPAAILRPLPALPALR